jgi:hypothetical protein
MYRRNRSEYSEHSERRKEATNRELAEQKEIENDADKTVEGFNAATAFNIRLSETANSLRQIGNDLVGDVKRVSETQAREVNEAVDREKAEVSNEAREAQREGEEGFQSAESGSSESGRFSDVLRETADAFRNMAEYFEELGDDSEEHQRESQQESSRSQEQISHTISQRRHI